MTVLSQPVAVALRIGAALDSLGIDWYVGGSVASSLHGIPRATQDVDLVADIRFDQAQALVHALGEDFYADVDLVIEAIRRRSSFNILDMQTATKVDIFVPRREPRARITMQRRQHHETRSDGSASLPIASPEDVILTKLDWYRRGGQVSERQWLDVLGVIQVNAPTLDRDYLNRQAALVGLTQLLDEALQSA